MMNPLISVIIPIYNVEKYLERCVNSVLRQTYQNLEIILVDDGSPDNCGSICDVLKRRDTRITVIHKDNGGLSDARNAALDIMQGEFVTFIDSDDFISDDCIEVLYRTMRECDADIAVGQFKYYRILSDLTINRESTKIESLSKNDALVTMFYQEKFETSACAKLYKASFFEGIRYPVGILYEDLATTHKIVRQANRVAVTNEIIYYYFIRGDSIMGEKFSKKKLDVLYIGDTLINEYKSANQEIQLALKCRLTSIYFNILLRMGHSKYKILFWERIKKYRWHVLNDTHARKKTKIACFISFFGLNSVNFFFNIVRNR